MTSRAFRQSDDAVHITTSAAGFNEITHRPGFPGIAWVTATYYASSKTLSAYGFACGVDHHLTVTRLDSSDEKRLAEVVMTLGITTETVIRRTLQTERFFYFFTRPHLNV